MLRKKINVSTVLAGQLVGLKEVDDGIWLVSFMHYDLGYIDLEQKPCNPSTTRSARGCHPCLRNTPLPMSPDRTCNQWCRVRDLNPRPSVYKTAALPLC
jgi:hypothetical protein